MTSSAAECPAPDFGNAIPPNSPAPYSNENDSLALSIANQNETYINYAQVGAWMNQLWLFEKLRYDETLRLSSPVLTAFYNNYQNGNIGTISNIDLALATLFNFSGTDEDFITQYNNAIDANNNLITTEDFELNIGYQSHFLKNVTMGCR
ncbi:MAG: hypothetical protein IPG85_16840 [Bacteroidetes bacterium]|nr:hypothetical protein [Bacteroidota bacterium]